MSVIGPPATSEGAARPPRFFQGQLTRMAVAQRPPRRTQDARQSAAVVDLEAPRGARNKRPWTPVLLDVHSHEERF